MGKIVRQIAAAGDKVRFYEWHGLNCYKCAGERVRGELILSSVCDTLQ